MRTLLLILVALAVPWGISAQESTVELGPGQSIEVRAADALPPVVDTIIVEVPVPGDGATVCVERTHEIVTEGPWFRQVESIVWSDPPEYVTVPCAGGIQPDPDPDPDPDPQPVPGPSLSWQGVWNVNASPGDLTGTLVIAGGTTNATIAGQSQEGTFSGSGDAVIVVYPGGSMDLSLSDENTFSGSWTGEDVSGTIMGERQTGTPDPEPDPDPDPQPDPDPPPTGGFNEPAGFSQIIYHDGDAVPGGWEYWENLGTLRSQGGVLVGTFPNGMGNPSGQRPFTLGTRNVIGNQDQVYIRFRIRVSSNWRGHKSNVNKIGFLRSGDTPGGASPAVLLLRGSGTGTLRLAAARQNSCFSSAQENFTSSGVINRGQWHVVEALFTQPVGLQMWLDGNRVLNDPNAGWGCSSFAWDSWTWDPVWGGSREVLDRTQTMEMDYMYLSGR